MGGSQRGEGVVSEGAGIQDDMRGWSYGNEGEPGIPSRAIELLREGADEIDRLKAKLAVAERERDRPRHCRVCDYPID